MTGELGVPFLLAFPQEPVSLQVTFMLPRKSNNLQDVSQVVHGRWGTFQDSRHYCQRELVQDRSRASGLVFGPSAPEDRTIGPNAEKNHLTVFHLVISEVEDSTTS